jgi:hypothetical protein
MNLWAVYQDGRPLHRGLDRAKAERLAAYLANGYESRRANDKRRVAEFDVRPDTGANKELDEIWKHRKD